MANYPVIPVSTVTPAAATVLDDTTVADMVNTLGGATSTGSGGIARATSPTFVTPILGTPTSGTLTNCGGLPESGLATTDVTTGDASTTKHGLLLKATAPASGLLSFVGIGNGETVYANKALFDTTNPAALGSVGPGTAVIAARRDHVHAAPVQCVTFTVAGTLTTRTGTARFYFNDTRTLTKVRIGVGTAPTGAALIVDVNKGGTTIFTTQSNRPEIAASGFTDESGTVEVTSMTAGDYLTVDIDQIGSTVAGADLVVNIYYT